MSDSEKSETETKEPLPHDPALLIPIPGGGVARLPLSVLKQYQDESLSLGHPPESTRDVTAHGQTVDHAGNPVWHTEFELGICDYVDQNGFPRHEYAWHNHPFGTEYTELYAG